MKKILFFPLIIFALSCNKENDIKLSNNQDNERLLNPSQAFSNVLYGGNYVYVVYDSTGFLLWAYEDRFIVTSQFNFSGYWDNFSDYNNASAKIQMSIANNIVTIPTQTITTDTIPISRTISGTGLVTVGNGGIGTEISIYVTETVGSTSITCNYVYIKESN